ncbi:putative retrotransposon ty1-copia subclass protein [Tanacetum coccineum]
MKGYVEQLERLGYVLPQEISVGLILNDITSEFVGFVRNYNMHNMMKMISELHALLIEYEKVLPKKAATPQVLAIQGGRIQKSNKNRKMLKGKVKGKARVKDKIAYTPKPKNPKPSAKEHLTKDDACHQYKDMEASGKAVELEEIQDEDTSPSENTSEIPAEWLIAMNEEMQSMKDNQVWRLVDLPPNGKTVRSKWLFKKKTDMDGNVYTYKARLVAKDYTQTYMIDYEETFSPFAIIRAIRILIAIATLYNYEI